MNLTTPKQNAPQNPKVVGGAAQQGYFASAARIVKMVAVCLAIACAPTACTVLTGFEPAYCGEGCQDV